METGARYWPVGSQNIALECKAVAFFAVVMVGKEQAMSSYRHDMSARSAKSEHSNPKVELRVSQLDLMMSISTYRALDDCRRVICVMRWKGR